MSLLSLVCVLSGCQKSPEAAQHNLSEITSISISCGHTDRSYGYSFSAHKKESKWFFDAECFTQNHETETSFKNSELNADDIKALLEILEQNKSIAYVENYKKPKTASVHIADEDTYIFCLTFSDKKQYVTYGMQSDLEKSFYRLAEKYSETT